MKARHVSMRRLRPRRADTTAAKNSRTTAATTATTGHAGGTGVLPRFTRKRSGAEERDPAQAGPLGRNWRSAHDGHDQKTGGGGIVADPWSAANS